MKKLLTLLFVAGAISGYSQIITPAASNSAMVKTTVGLTDITIDYSRPKAKGRKIFGKEATSVVPFGPLWRTGANSGTIISFSDDVQVEGTPVAKGKYLLLTWPGEAEWTVSLYKDVTIGGNMSAYKAENDAVRFKVKPQLLTEKIETFTMNITDLSEDNKVAYIQLAWENTSVKFKVTVDYDKKVMESITNAMEISGNEYFQAAVYYFETGKDIKKALEWITKAADATPRYWVLYQKARIQKAAGDKAGAMVTAKKSLEDAITSSDSAYKRMNEELIASLK